MDRSLIASPHARLGVYKVGENRFFNKIDALLYASISNTKPNVIWDFSDDIFSAFDWKFPVETTLTDLYKIRAQQLRDKYDYISLMFSGGADSTNILHAFIDNDILLDEIVMYRPAKFKVDPTDLSSGNVWSEIALAAVPHLKKYQKLISSKTTIRFIDLDDMTDQFLNDDTLVSQYRKIYNITAYAIGRTAVDCLPDLIWDKVLQSGKTLCYVHGIEKPNMWMEADGTWTFAFTDTGGLHPIQQPDGSSSTSEMFLTQKFHELFYWSPDLPQLVIKQCQIIKKAAAIDPVLYKAYYNPTYPMNPDFQSLLIPYLYPPHVSSIRDLFLVKKPILGLTSEQHRWFNQTQSSYNIGVMNDMVTDIIKTIDGRFFAPNRQGMPVVSVPVNQRTLLCRIRSKLYRL